MALPTDNTIAGANTQPILTYYMNQYGMTPPQMNGGGVLAAPVSQRQVAALSAALPPAPNRTIGLNEAAIRMGGAGLGGAQQGGLQALSDMSEMYGGIQDYNRSRALEDYNARVTGMLRAAQAQKAMGAGSKKNTGTGSTASKQASSDIVFDAATRAFDILNNDIKDQSFWNNVVTGGTGWASVIGKYVPEHKANLLNNLLTTLKGNLGFDKLQAMREASPTGGALGQVSEMELKQLNSAFSNFEQSTTPEELKYNLELALHTYMNVIHGEGNHNVPRPVPLSMAAQQQQQSQSSVSEDEQDLIRRNLPSQE